MKKIISFIALSSIFFSNVIPAFAMDGVKEHPLKEQRLASREAVINQKVQAFTDKRTNKLNERAAMEIDRRIESLNKLVVKINAIKKLNTSQKTDFVNQIQTEISNLQTLKAKIEADTDPAVLKTDVQSIVKSYRVYALFMPKIEVIAAADRMEDAADQISSLSAKLQTRIDSAKTAGQDVASLQTLLIDMKAKTADAKTQAANAINAVISLTPAGFPANKTTLKSARALLRVGHQDLMTAHHDAQSIIQGLHTLYKEENSSSSGFVKSLRSKHPKTPNKTETP